MAVSEKKELITPVVLATEQGQVVLRRLIDRFQQTGNDCVDAVAQILREVAIRGDAAVLEYGRRFDCKELSCLRVLPDELEAAYHQVDNPTLASIKMAASPAGDGGFLAADQR